MGGWSPGQPTTAHPEGLRRPIPRAGLPYLGRDLVGPEWAGQLAGSHVWLTCLARSLAESSRTRDQGGADARRGLALASASGLGAPAARRPHATARRRSVLASAGGQTGAKRCRLPRRSRIELRAARKGRSLRSRRIRSATPTLDPAAHTHRIGTCEQERLGREPGAMGSGLGRSLVGMSSTLHEQSAVDFCSAYPLLPGRRSLH